MSVTVELGQLEAFVQVANHRSFSRAAEALFLTQPSVTARIQSLERELSTRLFERSGRGVSLTDSGRAFLPHAKRALTSVQEGTDAIDAVRHGESGNIRIGASSSIATYVLPRLLSEFRTERPRVHVSLSTGTSEEVIDQLLGNEVHVSICRLTPHPQIHSIYLYSDDLTMAVAPAHPFARRGRVSVDEAGKEPFLFFERDSSYYRLISNMFLRAGVVPESVMELDSIETTKRMVEAGLGVAIFPVVAVERDLAEGSLVRVEIAELEQPTRREVGLHLLRDRQPTPALAEFARLVATYYAVDDTLPEALVPLAGANR